MTALSFVFAILLPIQAATQTQPGSIAGRILASNGKPATSVTVMAIPQRSAGLKKTDEMIGAIVTRTDTQGRYRLVVPPDRYTVATGLATNVPIYTHPESVTVARGATATNVVLRIPKVIRMNATILKAICKSCPLPELPELLRRVRISDTVVLSVITTHDGTSANVAKIRGHPLLDFVFSTVCQWRYKPQVVGGEPIEFRAVISYEVFSHAPLQIR